MSQLDKLLYEACIARDIRKMMQLLQKGASIRVSEDAILLMAAQRGDLEMVDFVLTSSELSEHSQLHARGDKAFIYACLHGSLPVVEYMLTSSKLKSHANMYAQNNDGFLSACQNGHLPVVRYLCERPDSEVMQDAMGITLALQQHHLDVAQYLVFHFEVPEGFMMKDNREFIELSQIKKDKNILGALPPGGKSQLHKI